MTDKNNIENENILNTDIENEMRTAYLDYSMSVIVSRALPDVRDGLKPVHRRILYGMQQLGITPDKPYRKSARLVGDVMGRFHPHGDTAIYDSVVRLAQDFNTRYPLADGQGNFGSIDGDSAAAMRYTEVRMTKLSLEMLRDLNKNTVDFQPNYNEEELEPKVLPSRFPNLLVNGSSGIAVGMSTNMAPHNLGEVIDACVKYLDNPNISIKELMQYIKGPDFPTGANIMGYEGIKNAYETGRGKIKLRAVANIEEYRGKNRILVTEIPYQVNKANLIKKIADLVRDKKIEGISDIRDDSNRTGIRIIIDLKRDAIPKVVLNNLYSKTNLESNFGVINLALVDGQPKILNLKDIIHYYILHQKEVVTRRTQFDLEKAENRAHIVKGLLTALDSIDDIISIIRNSYDDKEIKNKFLKKYGLDEIQSQAILDMRLKRLSGLEREKLEEEFEELKKLIARFKEILGSNEVLCEVIKSEMLEIKDKHSNNRRSRIIPNEGEINIEDLIKQEDMLITVTNRGYIKRVPIDTYKVQKRGGKGIRAMATKEDDFPENMLISSTHDNIMFLTNYGKIFSLKAYEIPEGSRQSKGKAVINILKLDKNEKISAMFVKPEEYDDIHVVMVTKLGFIKKMQLSEIFNVNSNGKRAISLRDDDVLIDVRVMTGDKDILIITQDGQCIRFNTQSIRDQGRSARGVTGIKLHENDNVIAADIIENVEYLFIATENGYGKKVKLSQYPKVNRGGKGVITQKTTKVGKIVGAELVNKEDQIMLISYDSNVIRLKINDISTISRNSVGVKLKNVKVDEEKIASLALISEIDDNEE